MSPRGAGRLVILSGPSCAGKSPLAKAIARFHPDLSGNLQSIVLDVMRRKLLRQAQRQKTYLSLRDLQEIERRAGSAYGDLKEAITSST